MSDRVERFDLGGFRSKPKPTQQGFLKLTGNLTRTGVLTYRTRDGKTVRELRHPDDVFSEDSLQSLSDAPVTDMHPSSMVSAENVSEWNRGTVRAVEPLGKFVTGELIVQDAKLIHKINDGSRRELSPGYTCTLEWTPGEYNGEKYDARQRNIVYNHLAFGPKGWGRSGPEVSVHMDSAATEIGLFEEIENMKTKKLDQGGKPAEPVAPETEETSSEEIPASEAETNPEVPVPAEAPAEEAQKTDDAVAAVIASEIATLRAEKDVLQAKLDAANELLKPEHFRAAVAKRVALESNAKKVLGDAIKFDSLDNEQLYKAALAAKGIKVDGKSVDYIEARFDAMLETVGSASIREVRHDSAKVIEKPDPRKELIAKMNSGKNLQR